MRSLVLHNQFAEARALWSLGGLHHTDGRLQQAEQCLDGSLRLWQKLRMPLYEGRTLDRLGMVQVASGQPEVARTTWRQALTISQAVGAPEAEASPNASCRRSVTDQGVAEHQRFDSCGISEEGS
jgi:hypothetical protein